MPPSAGTITDLSPHFEPIGHFRALALKAMVGGLKAGKRLSILDLGPASGATIEFFSNYTSRIRVEDLAQALEQSGRFRPESLRNEPIPEFNKLFSFASDACFDVILCWDLLNFLSAVELAQFATYISRFSTPDTVLYAHFFSTKATPLKPGRYRIEAVDKISFAFGSELTRSGSGFSQSQIKKLMPQFQIKASFLQRQGIREEVYSCIGDVLPRSAS